MFDTVRLKKGSIIMVETASPLPVEALNPIIERFKQVFPDNEVFFPNGAKITIIETD